jgi:hypothetical protein
MIQPSESLSVWHWTTADAEYIVAAHGAVAAAQALERIVACRGQTPKKYAPPSAKSRGQKLATARPGIIYRRARPAVG